MPRMGQPIPPFEVIQPDSDLFHVKAYMYENDYVYKVLPHNTLVTVWTPAAGKHLRIVGGIVSVESAGNVELYENSNTILHLEFNERKAVPIPIVENLDLGTNVVLKAKYVADTGTPNGYLTVVGHEK